MAKALQLSVSLFKTPLKNKIKNKWKSKQFT